MSAPAHVVRVGTRGSALALAQTNLVIARIRKRFSGVKLETIVIKTTGDKNLETPLSQIGNKGLFVKEIEEALINRTVSLAVHSLKDLPTELGPGLVIGAVLKNEDPSDCLVSTQKFTIETLPEKALVGTSSLRRRAQLKKIRPDLRVEDLRGNLDTRLRKLKEGLYDAIVVAHAGIKRLTKNDLPLGFFLHVIPHEQMLPAVGQGSLAIEIRQKDPATRSIIDFLDDPISRARALCERAFMKAVQGGCQVPIGARSEIQGTAIVLEGMIASPSGEPLVRKQVSGPLSLAEEIGARLGKELLQLGGDKILETLRS